MRVPANTLASGVRDAARYASLRIYDSASSPPSAAYLSAVRNMAVYGNPDGSGTAIVPALAPANISVTKTFDHGVPYQVTVFATFTLNNKPAASFPYLGRYAPPA